MCVFPLCVPFYHHLPNKKQFFFCYHKHSMSYSISSKYTSQRKDESEWVFDYSKWTEDVCCAFTHTACLEITCTINWFKDGGRGKWKRWQYFVLNLLARLAVPRQPLASSSLSPLKHCPDSDGDSYKSNLEKWNNYCNNGMRSTQGWYHQPWIESFHFIFL